MGGSYGWQTKAFKAGESCSLLPLEEQHICREIQTQVKPPWGSPSRNEATWGERAWPSSPWLHFCRVGSRPCPSMVCFKEPQHRGMQRRPSVKYVSSIGAWCVSFLVDRNLVCQSTQDFLICRLTCLAVLFARAPAVVFCAVRMASGT